MTSKEILLKAASLIERKGLAIEAGYKNGSFCTAAALVESAYTGAGTNSEKFWANEYVMARNLLCGLLGVNSSYQSLADWNDDARIEKSGRVVFKRTKEEVVKKYREAANLPDVFSEKPHKTK
jgi:hypothetical protein